MSIHGKKKHWEEDLIIELRFTILVNFEDVVRKHDDFMFFLFLRCSDDLSKRHYYSETSIKRIDTFGTFASVSLIEDVRLMEVVKIAHCLLTINIQWLICTEIKIHVVKEAIQCSSSLPFITNFNLFANAKTLTDFSTYFMDVIQYSYRQFSPVST